jgi:hypothetical protein
MSPEELHKFFKQAIAEGGTKKGREYLDSLNNDELSSLLKYILDDIDKKLEELEKKLGRGK